MKGKQGRIVEFTTDKGIQKAVIYNLEQTPAFQAKKKAILRLVDENLELQHHPQTKRPLIVVKAIKDLKIIGYVD